MHVNKAITKLTCSKCHISDKYTNYGNNIEYNLPTIYFTSMLVKNIVVFNAQNINLIISVKNTNSLEAR